MKSKSISQKMMCWIAINLFLIPFIAFTDTVDTTDWTVFEPGSPAVASEVNNNFDALKSAVDDNDGQIGLIEPRLSAAESDVAQLETSSINWDAVFSWGNHADQGYLTSYSEDDPQVGDLSLAIVPYWDGTLLANSPISIDSGLAGIEVAGSAKLSTSGDTKLTIDSGESSDAVIDLSHSGASDWLIRAYQGDLRFGTGEGTKVMFQGSTGRLGLGTTMPSEKLVVNGGNLLVRYDNNPKLKLQNTLVDNYDYWAAEYNETGDLRVLHYDKSLNHWGSNLILQDDGNVGIGTKTPTEKLHVNGSGGTHLLIQNNDSDRAQLMVYAANDSKADLLLGSNGDDHRWSWSCRDSTESYDFRLYNWNYNNEQGAWVMTFDAEHNYVGIGTTTPNYRLDVNGDINTTGEICQSGATYDHPDYVFDSGYALMPFDDLSTYIDEEGHLPGMPSAEDIQKTGVQLFEQNRLLVEKLEEAYLYILQLEERISKLEEE